MSDDVLAVIALLAIAGLVAAVVVAARRQRAARRDLFRRLAAGHGWTYLEDDAGLLESLAHDFEGFGRFRSSSAGKLVPEAVVLGDVDEGRIGCFLHGTPGYEGSGRQWWGCLVETGQHLCGALRIRPRPIARGWQAKEDERVEFQDPTFEQRFEVAAPDRDAARACLGSSVRAFLSSEQPGLPFPVAIQLRGRRVAAYLAGRNDEAETVADLEELVRFTRGLAAVLLRPDR